MIQSEGGKIYYHIIKGSYFVLNTGSNTVFTLQYCHNQPFKSTRQLWRKSSEFIFLCSLNFVIKEHLGYGKWHHTATCIENMETKCQNIMGVFIANWPEQENVWLHMHHSPWLSAEKDWNVGPDWFGLGQFGYRSAPPCEHDQQRAPQKVISSSVILTLIYIPNYSNPGDKGQRS